MKKTNKKEPMYRTIITIDGLPTKKGFGKYIYQMWKNKKPILIDGVERFITNVEFVAIP